MVGGATQNELLNQWSADAMKLPVVAGPVEASATGNVLMQAVSLGMLSSVADAHEVVRRSFPLRRYEPRDVDEWSAAKARLQEILARTRET